MAHEKARALTHRNVYPFGLDLSNQIVRAQRSAEPSVVFSDAM